MAAYFYEFYERACPQFSFKNLRSKGTFSLQVTIVNLRKLVLTNIFIPRFLFSYSPGAIFIFIFSLREVSAIWAQNSLGVHANPLQMASVMDTCRLNFTQLL